MTPRREEFIARHADFFVQHRCHLRLVPLEFAKTTETRSYLTSEQRNELLSHSRILLNVHHSEQRYFEWHRMLVGLANGCCVVTETCEGYGPLVPGKHFIMVEPEHLITACEYYLAHPDECEAIANAGREFIQMNLRQEQSCAAFLDSLAHDTSGMYPLPADPSAVAFPGELRQRMARGTHHLFWRAVREDLATKTRPKNNSSDAAASDETLRAATIAKRDAYRVRFAQQQETRARGTAVFELHDNDVFKRAPQPALTVLITLYNYAQHIEECVRSATAGIERLAQPAEIVIINDASTDESLALALQCARTSAVPLRVVDKKFNTGLADARNTGLALARAPYVFMMDADNLIFPAALPQLFAAISGGEYAAAYSILCRFRGTPQNRVGLLSSFDWDPQILVQYPYVDAMAMFRRDTLLELGGYDQELSQIAWFGWEDYDMWLRFAQRNLPVAFVPNTLCLYRLHETSMINTTNLFTRELVDHFIGCYGDLLRRFEPREKVFCMFRGELEQLRRGDSYETALPRHQRGGKASSKGESSSARLGL